MKNCNPVTTMNKRLPGQAKIFAGLLLVAACVMWMPSRAQQESSALKLADEYFAAGEYYTAANLYEQFLHPPKTKIEPTGFPLNKKRKGNGIITADVLFKQAESYRLANYWVEAAKCYEKCAETNSGHQAGALYGLALCQRSLGQYAAAEATLAQLRHLASANTRYEETVEKELQILTFIREQLARPDTGLFRVQKLQFADRNDKGAFGAVHVSGDQFLISSTVTDTAQVTGVNPHHSRLFYATLNNGKLEGTTPVVLSTPGPGDNQGAASISTDGNFLYYSQWKLVDGRVVSSIYYAVKEAAGWSLPRLLPLVNMKGYSSRQPFCSGDGKYLFFASDRPGGSGMFDIWYALLKDDGTATEPVNAGAVVNTAGDEQSPFYHNRTGTLVFSSNSRTGMGGYDLFAAKGKDTTWNLPENMGYPVNSARDDKYFFASENTSLLGSAMVSSDRGEGCCLELYGIVKTGRSQRLTGMVIDCKDSTPVANAVVTLKSKSGEIRESATDEDGKYVFDQLSDSSQDLTLIVNKESYKETISLVTPAAKDETDLLTDVLLNADVCVVEKLVIKPENVVTIYFDFDRALLKTVAISRLDSIYHVLLEFPSATIQISGFTDGLGSEEYNKMLSDKRAKACADYLVKKGIPMSRISFESFGACCPVEMEIINGRDNPDGRSLNRRALINIMKE